MACRLTAPRHHLNQSWLITNGFFLAFSLWQFHRKCSSYLSLVWILNQLISRLQRYLSRGQWVTWWRHQIETFSALLAICAGNSPVPGEFPAKRPVTRSFDVFFDLYPNKRLSKQWWGWWFETPPCTLRCHRNEVSPHLHASPDQVGLTIMVYWGLK